jgi:Zn-dependent metalloprotease
MHRTHCQCINCILPPHLLDKLLDSKDKEIRKAAKITLAASAFMRGQRSVRAQLTLAVHGDSRRTIFDCENRVSLTDVKTVMTENGKLPNDGTVKRAYEALGITREFYKSVLSRDSIDNNGMRLDGYVHYNTAFNNAFWNGQQMVFGDGDGIIFTDFTKSLDVIGHELAHGVTEFTAGLEYHDEPGALNESMSDVFGSLVKQWRLQHTADKADWLIGADIMVPPHDGFAHALRSMAKPGTAYDSPDLGKDPQPDNYKRYDHTTFDAGGVHINSGIPNKAFYEVATAIGGNAWEAAGHIWYESLLASEPKTQFKDFANTTYLKAGQLYGSTEQRIVLDAWKTVGVQLSSALVAGRDRVLNGSGARPAREAETLAAMMEQLKTLSHKVDALSKEMATVMSPFPGGDRFHRDRTSSAERT